MLRETAEMTAMRAGCNIARKKFQFGSSSVSPHMPLVQS
jgi:hypothetical protein